MAEQPPPPGVGNWQPDQPVQPGPAPQVWPCPPAEPAQQPARTNWTPARHPMPAQPAPPSAWVQGNWMQPQYQAVPVGEKEPLIPPSTSTAVYTLMTLGGERPPPPPPNSPAPSGNPYTTRSANPSVAEMYMYQWVEKHREVLDIENLTLPVFEKYLQQIEKEENNLTIEMFTKWWHDEEQKKKKAANPSGSQPQPTLPSREKIVAMTTDEFKIFVKTKTPAEATKIRRLRKLELSLRRSKQVYNEALTYRVEKKQWAKRENELKKENTILMNLLKEREEQVYKLQRLLSAAPPTGEQSRSEEHTEQR